MAISRKGTKNQSCELEYHWRLFYSEEILTFTLQQFSIQMINKRNGVDFAKNLLVSLSAMMALDFIFDNILGLFKEQPFGFSMSLRQFIIFTIFCALLSFFELRKQRRKEFEEQSTSDH